jgi:multiple sugar transport system substrate-binding protein
MIKSHPRVSLALFSSLIILSPVAGWADSTKPLAGQSITVILPSPQSDTLAADFEKVSGVKVDLQTMSWDDIRPKLVTSLIANTAPADVTEVDWSWTGQFGAANWYEPLEDKIDKASVDDMAPASIFRTNGHLIGIPYTNDFRVMIINRKQFTDAGVKGTPKTLDELVAAAKAVKAKGIVKYPIGLPLSASEGASTAWYLLTKAFGGELFDKDKKILFGDPDSAGYKAMAFELQLLKDGLVDPASVSLTDSQINETMFAQGTTSIMIGGEPGRLGQFADPSKSKIVGQFEAILVPTVDGKTRSFGLPEALGIPASSEHKEAALAFVKWMTSHDYQIKNFDAGFLPTRTSALVDLNKTGKLTSGDTLVAQAPTVEALFDGGTPAWYPEFSGAVNTNLNSAAKGQITLKEAMANIVSETEKAMKQ